MPVNPQDVRAYLEQGARKSPGSDLWEISGMYFPEDAALRISEFCLIMGQPLSSIISTDVMLALARRIATLEAALLPSPGPGAVLVTGGQPTPSPAARTATYAVIPSTGRACLDGTLEALVPQVDMIFLVRTGEFGVPDIPGASDKIVAIDDIGPPKNIQRWWNLGITAAGTYAKAFGQEQWNVLIINDDVVACPHLTETLDAGMRETTAVVAYPNAFDDQLVMLTEPGSDAKTRITGWCFMLRGEAGLRADEQFEWWYGDNDLDWTARASGGALCIPGCKVEHLFPGQLTSESAELTARTHVDRQLFLAKWNGVPH